MTSLLRRLRKRITELRYRFSNYRYYRRRGLSPALAWKKADLTL